MQVLKPTQPSIDDHEVQRCPLDRRKLLIEISRIIENPQIQAFAYLGPERMPRLNAHPMLLFADLRIGRIRVWFVPRTLGGAFTCAGGQSHQPCQCKDCGTPTRSCSFHSITGP